MKTTIELPDELFVAAKKAAAERRWPLKRLLEVALRKELNGSRTRRKLSTAEFLRRLDELAAGTRLDPGVDLSNRERMHEWLERDS